MRRFARWCALGLAVVAACVGDSPKNTTCSGDLYDPCNTEHDCQSALCLPFGSFSACTQACTAGDDTTCPKQAGNVVTCNAGSNCQPAAPNTCKLK